MAPIKKVKRAIAAFEAVTWSSCGDPYPYPEEPKRVHPGWVEFGIQKSELGWRTLEFIAWTTTDMIRAGERIEFFPTAPPPYLNDPGDCLSFVIEIHPKDNDQDTRFSKIAKFITDLNKRYWDLCKPEKTEPDP
jgi:hypothetical protein